MRHGALAHPLDERLLDLDHHGPLDARVGEDPLQREAEADTADEHRARLVDQRERLRRELDLAGGLEGVHHEDAVDPQLEDVGSRLGRAPTQHDVSSLGLGARDLHNLHVRHAPILHTPD